jgi:hypothetical protein
MDKDQKHSDSDLEFFFLPAVVHLFEVNVEAMLSEHFNNLNGEVKL